MDPSYSSTSTTGVRALSHSKQVHVADCLDRSPERRQTIQGVGQPGRHCNRTSEAQSNVSKRERLKLFGSQRKIVRAILQYSTDKETSEVRPRDRNWRSTQSSSSTTSNCLESAWQWSERRCFSCTFSGLRCQHRQSRRCVEEHPNEHLFQVQSFTASHTLSEHFCSLAMWLKQYSQLTAP